MTPPPSSHSSSAPYHRIPWSWIFQGGGLVLALIALFVASTKYPIVDWIGDAREYIQQLGFWSGIVYPITYALCNLLLVARRHPQHGRRILFWALVGIFSWF